MDGESVATTQAAGPAARSPAPPARREGQPAGFVSRLLAFVIDLLIINSVIVVGVVIGRQVMDLFGLEQLIAALQSFENTYIATMRGVAVALGAVAGVIFAQGYLLFFWTVPEQTPGMRLMGLRLVAEEEGAPILLGRALWRLVGLWLSVVVLFVGILWVLVDDERQGWHDKLASTYVIYTADGRPQPARALR